MKKLLYKIFNCKKQKIKTMIGKKVKLQPTPKGKAVSGNPHLTSDKRFNVIGIHNRAPKAWLISYEYGTNAGWVYEWEMADYKGATLEELRDEYTEKENEMKEIGIKIEWMEQTGSIEFKENEFKVYQTLKLFENKELTMVEKSRLIANLIN
jgi:hypothetical protein